MSSSVIAYSRRFDMAFVLINKCFVRIPTCMLGMVVKHYNLLFYLD